ncbi:MAG: polymer-forming cytoskeletal protein [Gammaproteobacteria bacterium]|nr:polymer-forming cytoskeletal protein [Gammaproteobacteria bacterium]
MATPDQPAPSVQSRPTTQGADSRTIIGKGVVITGEITGTGDVEIRGTVSGSITLKNNVATISKSGVAQASVTAKNVDVSGRVEGDIVAEELVVIRKDSTVAGNVNAPRVSLEDGAHFKGSVDMQSSKRQAAPEPQRKPAPPNAPPSPPRTGSTPQSGPSSQRKPDAASSPKQ